jgi:hypothetical protein
MGANADAINELRARVEALEGRYETQRLAALEWGKDVEMHARLIDKNLKRIMALEAARPAPAADPAPVASLVEQVACAVGMTNPADARIAIHAVASWLRNERQSPMTAEALMREAER